MKEKKWYKEDNKTKVKQELKDLKWHLAELEKLLED